MSRVVVVGAGGNIGSHAVTHLARNRLVRTITLLDREDAYDETNLWSQDIRRRDVGRPKAAVQARRVREIDPTIEVVSVAAAVETVPLGTLRADVVLACLDSRGARRAVSALAWRLGSPWIDAGVQADGLLARVNVYRPGPDEPCYECAWDDRDYEVEARAYPCTPDTPAATGAPSSLGALAAALQALECAKVLAGAWDEVLVGRQLTVDARGHGAMVTTFRRNPACRFDHEVWRIDPLGRRAEGCTLADVLKIGRRALGGGDIGLKVVDQAFATRLTCTACGAVREFAPYLVGRLSHSERLCDACGTLMRVAGFDVIEWLRPAELPAAVGRASLRSLGVRTGDVMSVAAEGRVVHFELGAA